MVSKKFTLEELRQIEQAENQMLESRMAMVPWINKQTWHGIEKLS